MIIRDGHRVGLGDGLSCARGGRQRCLRKCQPTVPLPPDGDRVDRESADVTAGLRREASRMGIAGLNIRKAMTPSVVSVAGPGVSEIDTWSTNWTPLLPLKSKKSCVVGSDASPTTSNVYCVKPGLALDTAKICAPSQNTESEVGLDSRRPP